LKNIEAMEEQRERETSFLSMNKENSGLYHDGAELRRLRAYLRWIYVDQSNLSKAVISWSVFFTLAYVVPILSHFLLDCSTTCDSDHGRPYHIPVQISLSVIATLSFISLSQWDRRYGFSRFLFLDKVTDESLKIQRGYAHQMKVCVFYFFYIFGVFCLNCMDFFCVITIRCRGRV
jgi:hypothetical protein